MSFVRVFQHVSENLAKACGCTMGAMDARAAKTMKSLQEALYSLAREEGIDHISVADIAARAGVNRSTFYQHYSDKETLLADALDEVIRQARAELQGLDPWSSEPPDGLVQFLRHVDEHAQLYRRVFTEPGYGAVLSRLRLRIGDEVRDALQEPDVGLPPGVPADVIAASVAGAFIGVIGEWLSRTPRPSVDTAAAWIWFVIASMRLKTRPDEHVAHDAARA